MDGRVRVWRRVGKENWDRWEFIQSLQGPDEITVSPRSLAESTSTETDVYFCRCHSQCMAWHPKGNVLAAGSNDSTVWMWQRKLLPRWRANDERPRF